jgi:hypothetical protein
MVYPNAKLEEELNIVRPKAEAIIWSTLQRMGNEIYLC